MALTLGHPATRFRVRRHPAPHDFLDRAEGWLVARETENNLILSLAGRLDTEARGAPDTDGPVDDHEDESVDPPPYLATVERDGHLVGCVLRIPPRKPILSHMPPEAAPAVVRDLLATYSDLSRVLGPPDVLESFAHHWFLETGGRARRGMRQGLYELTALSEPTGVPGRARVAGPGDVDLLASWIPEFNRDVGFPLPEDPRKEAERRVAGLTLLWEDGEPVSMAGRAGQTPRGARVGPVYTPAAHRGRGYGSAVTAAMTRRLLEEGLRVCYLFTDMANPTSNAIYRRLGYRLVGELLDLELEAEDG